MTDYSKWERINASIEDDEEDHARARLRMQKEEMTEQEVRRIHECWEKPEFRAMFDEYAQEVSDPKHKAETEAYLAQCEAEQRAAAVGGLGVQSLEAGGLPPGSGGGGVAPPPPPDGSQLLKPKKGFVVKTWKKEAGRKDFDRDLGKVFINVCQHADIAPPESKPVVSPDGRRGESWSLPNLCSPAPREEKDKVGHLCIVIDIVFHPEVLSRAEMPGVIGERWRQMVARTAVEQCASHHSMILDVDGLKVLKTKYYAEAVDENGVAQGCCTMAWKPAGGFEPKKKGKDEAGKGTAKTGTRDGSAGAAKATPAKKAQPNRAAAPSSDGKAAIRTPKHTLVHRGTQAAELSGAWNDPRLQGAAPTTRPKELLIRVELPEVSSAADVDLDITSRHLSLREEHNGYELELDFPFQVDETRGSAKFDRAKHSLNIVLPVVVKQIAPAIFTPATSGQSEEEAAAEAAAASAAEAIVKAEAEAAELERRSRERKAREERARAAAQVKEAARQAAIAQAAREAMARAQALARGAPPSCATESAHKALAAGAEGAPVPPPPVSAGAIEGFEAAELFEGPREGNVFKLGPAGLGYYADTGPSRHEPRPAVPPPTPPKEKVMVPPALAERESSVVADGESSPEWVMVNKEDEANEGEGNGAPPAATLSEDAARQAMPALRNGHLFELD